MHASARVVTAAALIMFSVFASFIFGDNAVIKSLGLALAFGVLVDAFVVRMTLVPADTGAARPDTAWKLPASAGPRAARIWISRAPSWSPVAQGGRPQRPACPPLATRQEQDVAPVVSLSAGYRSLV